MKRYVLFAGDTYYPIEEAKNSSPVLSFDGFPDWAHIADGENGLKIVAHQRRSHDGSFPWFEGEK